MTSLKLNDRGPEVRKLQLLLNAQVTPRPNLTPDAHFGPATHKAVVAFQKAHDLTADGVVGPKTRTALGLKPIAAAAPTHTLMGPLTDWVAIAVAELGVHEDSQPGKHNARILEYHQATTLKATTDETPWCSSFVNWVMAQSGRTGTGSALAKSWLDWGTEVTTPQPGDVVVIKKKTAGMTQATGSPTGYHVGFFVSQTAASIRLLGGNQSDRVKESNFMLSGYDVKGYRRPQ